ncbi:MAG TPA: phosphomannomutase/phosphoglucomutase [Longimicrobiales bacterium]|nr:phosphomannomutase/phosphoglucomutase [Longimicrobiales bacterium]
MSLNTHIFREYDIRGIVAADFTGDVPERIGRAYASELRALHGGRDGLVVAVGRDNRPTSPGLAEQVTRGIRAAGVHVLDFGTVPTPVLYYAAAREGTDGGLQITGSHNPPEYNGFKMIAGGRSVYGDAIQRIRGRMETSDYASGAGAYEARDILGTYVEDVGGRFHLERPIRVVVDCGNGTGSVVAVELLERAGAQVIPLYCESDGTFPNHHPDPTVDEYIQDLIATVRREGADLGVGFDGDADRIGAVDENGNIVRGDLLLLLFALDALERLGAPQTLVFDVKCSQAVPEVYDAAGGQSIMWKTGHSLIKEKMKEVGAPVAGELSGHICFGEDYYGFDDALYGACALMQLVSRDAEPLSARVAKFPQYVSTPEIRIDVTEETKFAIVTDAVAHFRRDYDVIDVDGVRVLFDGGWGLLRASNTQPVLVMRCEARTDERLAEIREIMEQWLRDRGVAL